MPPTNTALLSSAPPSPQTWTKPITLARHAYGDLYRASEMKIDQPGKCELVFTAKDGTETRELIHNFTSPGIAQGIHNLDFSIRSFARCCMAYALDAKQDLIFSAKDTISKVYDRNFREIFKDIFMSDMLATAYGSAAMMTSVLVSPKGCYEYEAAHGTVRRHYYRYLEGGVTSTNPLAIIMAWASALEKRGELAQNKELKTFGRQLKEAAVKTVEGGIMTADLKKVTTIKNPHVVTGLVFIATVQERLMKLRG